VAGVRRAGISGVPVPARRVQDERAGTPTSSRSPRLISPTCGTTSRVDLRLGEARDQQSVSRDGGGGPGEQPPEGMGAVPCQFRLVGDLLPPATRLGHDPGEL